MLVGHLSIEGIGIKIWCPSFEPWTFKTCKDLSLYAYKTFILICVNALSDEY